MTDGTEAELIARCRRGDADAWDLLFDRYYGVATRFIFQLSPEFTHEDAEEIAQETFLAVVRNLGSFRAKSAFQTWLLRVAANKAMDFREKTRAAKRGDGGATVIQARGLGRAEARPFVDCRRASRMEAANHLVNFFVARSFPRRFLPARLLGRARWFGTRLR
jgi:DNA-directed RNA polymerase specialized sigma24 family protein